MSKFASFFPNIRPDRSVKQNFQRAASPTRLGATKKHLYAYPQVQNLQEHIHHSSKKLLGFSYFDLANVKCQTLRMKTHSLSQPSTAYRNIPQLSSTWHGATKVLISSCWILLKLSVSLIYFVPSKVSELSMCLVVLYHHLPGATLVTWFRGFPWWLLQGFSASRSLHVMKSTSLVASPRVSRKSRTTWSKFSLGGWKSRASNTKVDVGWVFLS